MFGANPIHSIIEMTGTQRLIIFILLGFIIGVACFSFYSNNKELVNDRNKALIEALRNGGETD